MRRRQRGGAGPSRINKTLWAAPIYVGIVDVAVEDLAT
jgi:hypothetical protein